MFAKGLPFLLDLVFLVLFLVAMVTQVILPLSRGTKLFPFFRSKHRQVDAALDEARDSLEVSKKQQELRDIKSKPK